MSFASHVRALPVLFRTAFLESIAYRAEMLVWLMSTTMPLVMMAMWSAVAESSPFMGYRPHDFVTYFLATFVVRQLTACWVAYQVNQEVRDGSFVRRLMRPLHPLFALFIEQVAYIPLRSAFSVPLAVLFLLIGTSAPPTLVMTLLTALSILGGFLISFFASAWIGLLAFYTGQSQKLVDAWSTALFLLGGYLIPDGLFPARVRAITRVLPFRYQIGFCVELMTGKIAPDALARGFALQWSYIALLALLSFATYRHGVRRFEAYGG